MNPWTIIGWTLIGIVVLAFALVLLGMITAFVRGLT